MTRFFSPRRISILARSTFTQLVRMKVFWFLAPVGAAFIALQFFDLPDYKGPEASSAIAELRYHKNVCLGAMMLFGCLFGIVATALLIPRDIEDRTLYTILCKPVPRLDYLAGKLIGVLLVIFISMAVMDLLMCATLYFRMEKVAGEVTKVLQSNGYTPAQVQAYLAEVRAEGPTATLQAGALALFLKAAVLAGVALLISTFSTSTLFTIATSAMVWIIGQIQGASRSFWEEGGSLAARILTSVVSLAFPNFKTFDAVADGAARAEPILPADLLNLGGLAFFYIGIYLVLSWFVFSDKEF